MSHQPQSESPTADGGPAARNPLTRFWPIGLVLLAMIALFWPRTDDVAPDGNLLDEMSQEVPLRPSQTRVTLVHLWATWCPPCIDEIPALQRLQRDYGEREDMRIVFIAVDDSPEKVKPFLGSIGTPVLYDPSWKLAHRYGTRKLPETHLVVDGRVVETFEGAANWDDPAIRRLLDKALAGPSL